MTGFATGSEVTSRGRGVLRIVLVALALFFLAACDRADTVECKTPQDNIKRYEFEGGCGIFCTITTMFNDLLNSASRALVTATVNNPSYTTAVQGALVLYVTIYGAMVALGFVQVALGDAAIRMLKLGAVAGLVTSSTVWVFFEGARCFFIEGTAFLIKTVSQVGLEAAAHLSGMDTADLSRLTPKAGSNPSGTICEVGSNPLSVLEEVVSMVFSSHMFLVLVTLFMAKIYGFIMVIFLLIGLFGFALAVIYAVTMYLTSLIAQYLLLSLLPFFIAFLLFERTKFLFLGWINQLVTYSLIPIFLFAAISLFILIIEAALVPVLDVEICWDKWFSIAVFDIYKWHFSSGGSPLSDGQLPFGFFEVFIFILLIYLMKEFEGDIEQLARDVGGAMVSASAAGRLKAAILRGKDKVKGIAVNQAKTQGTHALVRARGAIRGHDTGMTMTKVHADGSTSTKPIRGVGGIKGGKEELRRYKEQKKKIAAERSRLGL